MHNEISGVAQRAPRHNVPRSPLYNLYIIKLFTITHYWPTREENATKPEPIKEEKGDGDAHVTPPSDPTVTSTTVTPVTEVKVKIEKEDTSMETEDISVVRIFPEFKKRIGWFQWHWSVV